MSTHKTLIFALATLSISLATPCRADTSEHQRVGLERKDPLIISPGIAITVHDGGEPNTALLSGADFRSAAETALTMNETFSIDVNYRNKWNFFASMPFRQTPSLDIAKAGSTYAAWGDPDIGAGQSFRFRDWKIEASMRWTFPLGIWNAYEAEAKHIRSGSGYHRITAACSLTRFMDPVALVLSIESDTTLMRKERFGSSREPLSVSLPAAITWATNSRLALQARLAPGFSLPAELNSVPVSPVIGRTMHGSLSATISGEKNSAGVQTGKDLLDAVSTPSLTFYY